GCTTITSGYDFRKAQGVVAARIRYANGFEPGSALCGRAGLALPAATAWRQSFPCVLAEVIASSQRAVLASVPQCAAPAASEPHGIWITERPRVQLSALSFPGDWPLFCRGRLCART